METDDAESEGDASGLGSTRVGESLGPFKPRSLPPSRGVFGAEFAASIPENRFSFEFGFEFDFAFGFAFGFELSLEFGFEFGLEFGLLCVRGRAATA